MLMQREAITQRNLAVCRQVCRTLPPRRPLRAHHAAHSPVRLTAVPPCQIIEKSEDPIKLVNLYWDPAKRFTLLHYAAAQVSPPP